MNDLTQPEIAHLYKDEPNEWRKIFFPEYDGLPWSATVISGNIRGTSIVQELAPWKHYKPFQSVANIRLGLERGEIDPIGKRLAYVEQPSGAMQDALVAVPFDEYVDWTIMLNYYRNGELSPWNGQRALDPGMLGDEVLDIRGQQYLKNRRKRDFRQPIRCKGGVYFRQLGPKGDWGQNSLFFPHNSAKPSYISDRWGPDYRPDKHKSMFRPTQEKYDSDAWHKVIQWI